VVAATNGRCMLAGGYKLSKPVIVVANWTTMSWGRR